MSTFSGLLLLLKEWGIFMAIHDPQSWDGVSQGFPLHCYIPKMAVILFTTLNLPMNMPTFSLPSVVFKCRRPPQDNFLVSKLTISILGEVREKHSIWSSKSQEDVSISNLKLVDKVRRFGVAKVFNSGQAHVPTLTEGHGLFLCGHLLSAQVLIPGDLVPNSLPFSAPLSPVSLCDLA